jgi:hypothetical protein
MNWIDNIIKKSSKIEAIEEQEQTLIDKLISTAINKQSKQYPLGILLAAFYDLAISAVYYSNITNSGWIYCKEDSPRLLLPFVNCCPIHALKGRFVFHKSSKPTSAKIGQATTRILLLFYKRLFENFNLDIDVLKATEPADAIFIDRADKFVFFGEIKSSPLLTLPLSMGCEEMTTYDKQGDIVAITHKATDNPHILNNTISIVVPKQGAENQWIPQYYSIGTKRSLNDVTFAYNGIINLIKDDQFLITYVNYWMHSFKAYSQKSEDNNIFWLTNACGKPSNLPNDWMGGVTCISDEKTSVGMDRTDDIKKGIYQVLKLGSEGKLVDSKWSYKVGIISNIHPVRHFDVYLKPIKDLIWTISEENDINFAKQLPPDQPMFNLFDGIITFTKVYSRDRWVSKLLKMLE